MYLLREGSEPEKAPIREFIGIDGLRAICDHPQGIIGAYREFVGHGAIQRTIKHISHLTRISLQPLEPKNPTMSDMAALSIIMQSVRDYNDRLETKYTIHDFFGDPDLQKKILDSWCMLIDSGHALFIDEVFKPINEARSNRLKQVNNILSQWKTNKNSSVLNKEEINKLIPEGHEIFPPEDIMTGITAILNTPSETLSKSEKENLLLRFRDYFQDYVPDFGKSGYIGHVSGFAVAQINKALRTLKHMK